MTIMMQQNVPMCPKCSALMITRNQYNNLYFVCQDCNAVFKVIGKGQAEIELIVTDEGEEVT